MVRTITILLLPLRLFHTATHGGITAQTGSAIYSWCPIMQHSTSLQQLLLCIELLPRHINTTPFTGKTQQSFKDPIAQIKKKWRAAEIRTSKSSVMMTEHRCLCAQTHPQNLDGFICFHTKSRPGTKQGNVIRRRNKRPALVK